MPEHFQRWVTETVEFCSVCGRQTRHAVSGGRIGHCLEHERSAKYSQAQLRKIRQREEERRNPKLF